MFTGGSNFPIQIGKKSHLQWILCAISILAIIKEIASAQKNNFYIN